MKIRSTEKKRKSRREHGYREGDHEHNRDSTSITDSLGSMDPSCVSSYRIYHKYHAVRFSHSSSRQYIIQVHLQANPQTTQRELSGSIKTERVQAKRPTFCQPRMPFAMSTRLSHVSDRTDHHEQWERVA